MKPEPLSEPVHGVHPHLGGAAGGGPRPVPPARNSRKEGPAHNPHLRFQGNRHTQGVGKGRQRGEKEKMSPRRGSEKQRALEAPLEDEWRLPSQRSPGVTPFTSRSPPQPPGRSTSLRGPRTPGSEHVPRVRAATTARVGTGSPGRFVTETSPHRGGPGGENNPPETSHREG